MEIISRPQAIEFSRLAKKFSNTSGKMQLAGKPPEKMVVLAAVIFEYEPYIVRQVFRSFRCFGMTDKP